MNGKFEALSPNQKSSCNAYLKKVISEILIVLGFQNARQVINSFSVKLLPKKMDNVDYTNLEHNLLKLILSNFNLIKVNPSFEKIIKVMMLKSKQQACEGVLKLILFCNTNNQIDNLCKDINKAKQLLAVYFKEKQYTHEELEKYLGYLFTLNLNKYAYTEIAYFSLKKNNRLDIYNLVKNHLDWYVFFIEINKLASIDASASKSRRNLLFYSGLLETHLQRDPEEIERYNGQMAAAQGDKDRLLDDLAGKLSKVAIIDIGPAGGATFKSVFSKAQALNRRLHYYGIEFDNKELEDLNCLLEDSRHGEQKSRQLMKHAHFIQGNAFDLSKAVSLIKRNNPKVKSHFLSIILSSVIHEIYSYCENQEPNLHTQDIQTMFSPISGRYNPETVYKIYYEALKAINEHGAGGALNIRDGVMCSGSDETVVFSISDECWLSMFKDFLQDPRYAHLQQNIALESLALFHTINLPAKYLQEFVLKANWGPESFGNEINEVYCYMTLKDHIKVIQRAANDLQIKIDIPVHEEYVQEGYRKHINESKIRFFSKFNFADQFPPTNMHIKVVKAEDPEVVYAHTL